MYCFLRFLLVCSGDEEEDPPVNVTALTSTSRTLVISESRPTTDETSPRQQVTGHSTPVGSPRAPSPKKARIELGKEASLLTGSSATPSMGDVRPPFIHISRTFQPFQPSFVFYLLSSFLFPMLIFTPPFSLSAFNEGVYSSWYPIHRVP
jgi:hypothetical protein